MDPPAVVIVFDVSEQDAATLFALGAVAAAIRVDRSRTVLLPFDDEGWPCLQAVLADLADLRYRGQSFEPTVPVSGCNGPADLAVPFHAVHEWSFGHADEGAPLQVVSLRVSASRPAPAVAMPREDAPSHAAVARGTARLHVDGDRCEAALFDRTDLDLGAELTSTLTFL